MACSILNQSIELNRPQSQHSQALSARNMRSATTEISGLEPQIIAKLHTDMRLVIPQSMREDTLPESSLMDPNAQSFVSPLLRQIIFSVTNNFAGLGAFSTEQVLLFLQNESDVKLYQLISQAPEYSAEAFVENAFGAVIEAGDARSADLLLKQKSVYIDINNRAYWRTRESIFPERYSPIEAATISQKRELAEVLLNHHADVSRVKPNDGSKILDIALKPLGDHQSRGFDHQIFRMLLDAGADLSKDTTRSFSDRLSLPKDSELLHHFMIHRAHENAFEWKKWYFFRQAINESDECYAMSLIRTMIEVGADLNHRVYRVPGKWEDSGSVIDAAAKRGNYQKVKTLFDTGAELTRDTLSSAISSGNEDLIELILDRGGDPNSAIDTAAKCGSYRIAKMLFDAGAELTRDTLSSAISSGNEDLIELILDRGGDPNGAINTAAKCGSYRIAKMLFDAGAHLTCDTLFLATESENEDLVGLILDKGADPSSILDTAARDGKYERVKMLFDAGAQLTRDILPSAILSGNEDLIDLILENSGDTSVTSVVGLHGLTPLAAAICLDNERVIVLIKKHGAMEQLSKPEHLSSAFKAALEVMNLGFIEDLIANGAKLTPEDFNLGLAAIHIDLDKPSRRPLSYRGAKKACLGSNFGLTDEAGLSQALELRDIALVHVFLDAQVYSNDYADVSVIVSAMKWGYLPVIEVLILSGFEVLSGLPLAVTHRNLDLVNFYCRLERMQTKTPYGVRLSQLQREVRTLILHPSC